MKSPFKSSKLLTENELEKIYKSTKGLGAKDTRVRYARKELETKYGGLTEHPLFNRWQKKKLGWSRF